MYDSYKIYIYVSKYILFFYHHYHHFYYQEWLRSKNPQAIINRFERGNFEHNEECWQLYIAALAQTGKTESILPRIMHKLEQTSASWSETAANQAGKAASETIMANNMNNNSKTIPKEVLQQIIANRGGAGGTAAIASGSGNKGNPIYVVVEEGN